MKQDFGVAVGDGEAPGVALGVDPPDTVGMGAGLGSAGGVASGGTVGTPGTPGTLGDDALGSAGAN